MSRNALMIGFNEDELYEVDTIEDIDIEITKNIYSIEDPSKRLSDFTKTVQIPGSKNNDGIFNSLFDVNFHIRDAQQLNPDFNPAKKAVCYYMQDQVIQIEGYCQLVNIIVLENNKVTYEIVIYGLSADLYSKMGNSLLTDIEGLGAFFWNDANIKASWSNPTGLYFFPYVDRGTAFAWRNGVSVGNASVDYNSFKPWINVYYILFEILDNIGIDSSRIQSDFLNSDMFRRLIIECDISKFVLDAAARDDSKAEAIRNTDQTVTFNSTALADIYNNQQWIFNTVVQDNFNQYDNTTGTITVLNEGYHTLIAPIEIYVTLGAYNADVEFSTFVILKRAGTYQVIWSDIYRRTTAITPPYTTGFDSQVKIGSMWFKAGDEIRVCVGNLKVGGSPAFGQGVDFISGGLNAVNVLFYEDSQFTYDSLVNINNILPNMKQTDFFMGIVKMFNLYIEPQSDGTYIIEPRDDFFLEEVTDWTEKLDVSQDFKITPEGLLKVKQVDFNYIKGEDDVSTKFYQETGEAFGHKKLIFDNDFVKEIQKVEIPFVCEPLQYQKGQQIVCIKTNYGGVAAERSANPIIAFAGDLQPCLNYAYFDAGAMTYTNYTTYPYAGFLNDPLNPEHDLCFAQQEGYFHTTPSGRVETDNYLYNAYHREQWEQIGDRDSKMVECYIKLNPIDINQLSFRKIYWIRNAGYRLLEVQDYKPNGNATTKVILLKLNLVDGFTPSQSTVLGDTKDGGGGTGGGGGGDHTGGGGGDQMQGAQVFSGVWQGGQGNVINSSIGVLVTGFNNTVGSNCSNITIKGSNNTVFPGLSNVTLINCTDLTITESDVVYINNSKVALVPMADTGLLTFASPGLSIASSTQINIGALTGWVVDNETDPSNPTATYIDYPGGSNITVTTIGSGPISYILIGAGNVITFQNTFPTSAERKANIWLGKVAHPGLTTLTVIGNEPDIVTSPIAQYRDMFQALGPYINDGVVAYANGANLTINITQGNIHGNGINFVADNTTPNEIVVGPVSGLSYLPRTQTGLGGGAITNVDVDYYDVAGTVTAIPGSVNRATIRYIYYIPNLGFIIQYGQTYYTSLSEAISAVGRESHVVFPNLVGNAILLGVLVATKGCTALNDSTTARFFAADKIGQIGGSTAGVNLPTAFTQLTDVPSSYSGQTLKAVRVNAGETALEFYTPSTTGLPWTEVTGTTQSMAVNNGYIVNNASLVTLTLPSTASSNVGDILRIVGSGAGGWKIAQNASQKIVWTSGGVASTDETITGVAGSLSSTDYYDCIDLIYLASNKWSVQMAKGVITIV